MNKHDREEERIYCKYHDMDIYRFKKNKKTSEFSSIRVSISRLDSSHCCAWSVRNHGYQDAMITQMSSVLNDYYTN